MIENDIYLLNPRITRSSRDTIVKYNHSIIHVKCSLDGIVVNDRRQDDDDTFDDATTDIEEIVVRRASLDRAEFVSSKLDFRDARSAESMLTTPIPSHIRL